MKLYSIISAIITCRCMFILQISSFSFNSIFYSPFAVRLVYFNFGVHPCISALLRSSAKLQQFFMRSRFVELWFLPSPKKKPDLNAMSQTRNSESDKANWIAQFRPWYNWKRSCSPWCFCVISLHADSQKIVRSIEWIGKSLHFFPFIPDRRWWNIVALQNADPIRFGYLYIFVCASHT